MIGPQVNVYVEGKLNFLGSYENPIIMQSSDGYFGSIYVSNQVRTTIILIMIHTLGIVACGIYVFPSRRGNASGICTARA